MFNSYVVYIVIKILTDIFAENLTKVGTVVSKKRSDCFKLDISLKIMVYVKIISSSILSRDDVPIEDMITSNCDVRYCIIS